MTTTPASIFARAYEALENEDFDGVLGAMAEAVEAGVGEDDPRYRYLRFMTEWLDEEATEEQLEGLFEGSSDLLDAAAELSDVAEAARITLDLADVLAQYGELDDVEHALRTLSERKGLSPEADGEARMMRAQIQLETNEDPEEALEILDGAHPSLHEDPNYVGLRAAVLSDLDRSDEAIELLSAALERSDDTELRYQLGLTLRRADRSKDAVEQLLEVRRRDLVEHGVNPDESVPTEEVEDLRRRMEDVLDTLPDPVMARVAAATIRVERWASEDAVRKGADPRTTVAFEGQPISDDSEGQVDALVIHRDAIVAHIDDDEQIADALAYGLVEEFDRFFDLELIPGS